MNLNAKTLQHLQYFVGKVCTIITPPINRTFDELRSREHFVIRVQEVTADGIWGTHPTRNTVSFFQMASVITILEEQEIDPTNPEHQEMIKEYEAKTGKRLISDVQTGLPKPVVNQQPEAAPSQFIDINKLASLARETKRGFVSKEIYEESKDKPKLFNIG